MGKTRKINIKNRKTYKKIKGGAEITCKDEENYKTRINQQLDIILRTRERGEKVPEKAYKKMNEILNNCYEYINIAIDEKQKTVRSIINGIKYKDVQTRLVEIYNDMYKDVKPTGFVELPMVSFSKMSSPNYYVPTKFPSPSIKETKDTREEKKEEEEEEEDDLPRLIAKSFQNQKIKLPIEEKKTIEKDYSNVGIRLRFHLDPNEMLNYWLDLFNSVKQKDSPEYTLQTLYNLKTDVLDVINGENKMILCDSIKRLKSKYLPSKRDDVSEDVNGMYCTIFIIISILSGILYLSKQATLLLKGGKAIQMYSDIPSNDIDILIAPYIHEKTDKTDKIVKMNKITDEEINNIGKKIADFIIWLTAEPLLKVKLPIIRAESFKHGELQSHVIKCIYQPSETDIPIPMVDISLGFNHMDRYIQHLMSRIKRSNLFRHKIYYPEISSIIKEKLYYILQYTHDNADARNRYFRDRAIISLLQLFEKEKDVKLFNNQMGRYENINRILHSIIINNPKLTNLNEQLVYFVFDILVNHTIPRWICVKRCGSAKPYKKYTNIELLEMLKTNPEAQFSWLYDYYTYKP